MKHLLILVMAISVLFSQQVLADGSQPDSARYDLSSTSLAPTYSSSAPSLALSGVYGKNQICLYNASGGEIDLNVSNGSSGVPTEGVHELHFPAGVGRCVAIPVSSKVYARSLSGTLNSGYYFIEAIFNPNIF